MDGVIGREIAGFRVEREIGRGGMGVVYLATQTFPERRVALKLLSSDLAEDPAFRERFVRESNAAASTEHPNIVPVYGAGEVDGQLYLAMRFIEGTDLGSLLTRQGALPLERAARICAQVADALEAAHKRGLVHRDVKPANVLLDDNDHAYLSDFGLTRRSELQTVTQTGQFMGTVGYVAPEQIRGEPTDRRADIYSLGCVLYESLTGSPPFQRDSEVATLYAQLENPSPRPSDKRPEVPMALDELVAKATAKRPDDRFATAGEMAGALYVAVIGERGPDRPPPTRRARVRLAVVAVLGLLVAAIAVVALTRGDGAAEPSPSANPSTSSVASGEAPPPGSLVRVSAEGGAIDLTVEDLSGLERTRPVDPTIAVGEGGVWFYSASVVSDVLTVIDDGTGAVVEEIPLQLTIGAGRALAVGSRTVWLIGAEAVDRVSRINPATLERLASVTVRGGATTDIVLGAGVLWVGSSNGTVTKFDPLTGRRHGELDLEGTPDQLAFADGSVWALDQLRHEVIQIDSGSGRVVARIDVIGNFEDIAAGDGGVWILDDFAGTVTQIDPQTGIVSDPIGVGPAPAAIAVGLGSAWIADGEDGKIYRVDPELGSQEPVDVGAPLIAVAVDGLTGSLWVAVLDPVGVPVG